MTIDLVLRFELLLELDAPMRYDSLSGARGFSRVLGGTLSGPGLDARVATDGGDYELVRPDGVVEIDGRYVARTDDGIVLYLQNRGFVLDDGSIRCSPRIETSPGRLQALSRALIVGVGRREAGVARIRCYEAP
ncbi:MAG: DUF3237 domain-containing protein [Burkholderiales bacterium]